MSDLGVYVHVPFCRKKCAYCDFYSVTDGSRSQAYLKALISHMEEFFAHSRKPCGSVYIGGGTPSFWGGENVARVVETVKKRAVLLPGAEITCEANPESADERFFKTVAKAGVNRISLGVQSSCDEELRRIGRIHDFAAVKKAVELCRTYCTDDINLDLIYGLPGQTMTSFQKSVEDVLALMPRHVSLYALKLEEGTPLYRESPVLPDDDEQVDMYLWACERLKAEGLLQYEISNFAIPGHSSRHNIKYWTLDDYIGFGPGAHSFVDGVRFYNISDVDAYISGIENRLTVVEEEDELSVNGGAGEYVILILRTRLGLRRDYYESRFGLPFDPIEGVLEKYIPSGHVEKINGGYMFTPRGFMVSNTLLVEIMEASFSCGHI